jgi:hypothetical protein
MRLRISVLACAAVLPAVLLSGAASAQVQKPGPPGEIAEGYVHADLGAAGRQPCLTAVSTHPGARLIVQACSSKLNALQRWKILRVHQVIIMGLAGQPGSCLGGVPEKVKKGKTTFYYAVTYDCGQEISVPEGILLGHIGSVYNTVSQAHGGKLLSIAFKRTANKRWALWLPSNGNIPYVQVWLFPKFKRITP